MIAPFIQCIANGSDGEEYIFAVSETIMYAIRLLLLCPNFAAADQLAAGKLVDQLVLLACEVESNKEFVGLGNEMSSVMSAFNEELSGYTLAQYASNVIKACKPGDFVEWGVFAKKSAVIGKKRQLGEKVDPPAKKARTDMRFEKRHGRTRVVPKQSSTTVTKKKGKFVCINTAKFVCINMIVIQ